MAFHQAALITITEAITHTPIRLLLLLLLLL
jgi:hypothetical protein